MPDACFSIVKRLILSESAFLFMLDKQKKFQYTENVEISHIYRKGFDTMKKIKEIYKPYMMRPIIYKAVTRFSVGLCVALLWDRFVNVQKYYSMTESCFFVIGLYLILMAWLCYLRLDGINPRLDVLFRKMPHNRKRHRSRDIVDFVDEKIVSFDELDDDEQLVATLGSNLLAGLCFLVISLCSFFA